MLGAIIGDIIGSPFEKYPIKTKNFNLFSKNSIFTDDTVMTIAIAKSLILNTNYINNIIDLGLQYNNVGYGYSFRNWLRSDNHEPYNSWGNGSAMRVSPIGFFFESEEEVLYEAKKSAEITHNHKEGIKGAEAVALAIFMARNNKSKEEIRERIAEKFNYNLFRTVNEIRKDYKFQVSCQKSVPESIICFLDSTSFEDAVRNAVSLGGDSDTMACIAGGISEAFYKDIPQNIINNVYNILPQEFLEIILLFYKNLK